MALLDRIRMRPAPEPSSRKVRSHAARHESSEPSSRNAAQEERSREIERKRKREHQYQEFKSRVHERLFERIDFSKLAKVSEERASSDIADLTLRILDEEKALFNTEERQKLVSEIQDEVFGLGPLEPLLHDPTICDILVNRYDQIYIERQGRLEVTAVRFLDDGHLMRIIEKILTRVGRRVDESTPMMDARLKDGSRVNVIIPPLALDGPTLSIRRFSEEALTADSLVESGSITPAAVTLLEACVVGRLNILISGGTGSGKTTLLNMLSAFVPESERIVSIEDSAELQLHQEHVVRLETRPPNIEGKGQVSQRELVINCLRMRPDRIIVGEVRGVEALDMLQAMSTGHEGSLTTVHANTPRDALMRVGTMVAMSGLEIPASTIRAQMGSAIDLVIQVERFSDGSRGVTHINEVTGASESEVTMQELFALERRGVSSDGRVERILSATGLRPSFLEKLRGRGIDPSDSLFVAA